MDPLLEKALIQEAGEIIVRIAAAAERKAEPEVRMLAAQFGERLQHLEERLGGKFPKPVEAPAAVAPAPSVPSVPAVTFVEPVYSRTPDPAPGQPG